MVRRFVFLALVALAAASVSCSQYEKVCAPVLQATNKLEAKFADIQRARTELLESGLRDKLQGEHLKRFDDAMRLIDDGYRLGVQTLAMVEDACKVPDLRSAIDLVVRGFDLIMPLVALIGGEGTPAIVPPIVWSEARGR